MKVKEVICYALQLVGRDDVAQEVAGSFALSSEVARLKNIFLTYFNSVLDELARGYFPLSAKEDVFLSEG